MTDHTRLLADVRRLAEDGPTAPAPADIQDGDLYDPRCREAS
jgi:hypothetical protein